MSSYLLHFKLKVMVPLIAAGLITAGTTIASQLLQNRANRKAQDRMNEYNSPKSQMARYTDAGLNPNLIYGQGTPGNQPSPVSMGVPKVDTFELIAKALAIQNAQKQNKMMDAQAGLLYSRTYNEDMKGIVERLKGEQLGANKPYFSLNAKYSSEAQRGQLANVLKNLDVKQAQLVNLKLDRDIKSEIRTEKQYYNTLRRETGIEKGDNILFRGGYGLGKKAYDWYIENFKP